MGKREEEGKGEEELCPLPIRFPTQNNAMLGKEEGHSVSKLSPFGPSRDCGMWKALSSCWSFHLAAGEDEI